MRTRLIRDVATAAGLLQAGRLVAFPTETVYGLGADGLDPAAVAAIFAAKGRPAQNPLILHVADVAAAAALAHWTPLAADLAARFWPGPLTLVLLARPGVPAAVRAGLETVALRCPDHGLAQALLRATGRPLAAPSANRSGRPSPTTAQAVLEELDGRIAAVLDGGPCALGLESTVVQAMGSRPVLLRLGALPAEALGLPPQLAPGTAGQSPGTAFRHYAPAVPLFVTADLAAALAAHPGAAVLATVAEVARLGLRPGPGVVALPEAPRERAAGLFAALRTLERSGRPCIIAQALPPQGLDAALMDRLARASTASLEESAAVSGSLAPGPGEPAAGHGEARR